MIDHLTSPQSSKLYWLNTIGTSTIIPVHQRHRALKRKPVKCIQKNKKPAYDYVDLVNLHPLQQYPGTQAPHDLRTQAHLPENRIFGTREYPKEELTPDNVRGATSLALLRTRARSVRANYKRYWECLRNLKPDKFKSRGGRWRKSTRGCAEGVYWQSLHVNRRVCQVNSFEPNRNPSMESR